MRSKTDRIMCGTCQFWTGNRIPIFDQKGVPKVDILDPNGNCENEACSRFCGQKRECQKRCKYFSKWTELL